MTWLLTGAIVLVYGVGEGKGIAFVVFYTSG
jgi:hypothetical protein